MWGKPPAPFKDPGLEHRTPSEGSREKYVKFLRKGRNYNRTGNGHSLKAKARENIKFRPLDDDDSADSETEVGDISVRGARHTTLHPWPPGAGSAASTNSSTPTALGDGVHSHVDGGKDLYRAIAPARLPTDPEVPDPPDYSDREADPDWTPRFLQNKARFPKPKPDSLHIAPPPNQVPPGAGRHDLSEKNLRNPSQRDDSPRWQAFWRDVEEIQHKSTN